MRCEQYHSPCFLLALPLKHLFKPSCDHCLQSSWIWFAKSDELFVVDNCFPAESNCLPLNGLMGVGWTIAPVVAQTFEHNACSLLLKLPFQQSKQEAKVNYNQTAPFCCSQPIKILFGAIPFVFKMYLLSELLWRLHFKCELKLPSIAIVNVSHTITCPKFKFQPSY